MTARVKLGLIMGALICVNVAVWGAKTLLAGMFDPIIRALAS